MPNRPLTQKEKNAWRFAKELHTGQVRKFIGSPYFDAHVKKVNAIVKQFTTDEDILCASLLHDTIEDCYDDPDVGHHIISEKFGKRVADIVMELTSSKEEIENEFNSKADYLIVKMIHMSDDALIIKLADRLQNISDAFTASERFRNNYFQETVKIIDELEKNRRFNRVQGLLINQIKMKLQNIGSIFKLKRFDQFNERYNFIRMFESQDFSWFKDLFLELKHDGFTVRVEESNTQKADFSRLDSFGSWDLQTKNYTIKTINVKVEKRKIEDGIDTLKSFNINEIKETLMFAESYAKGELGLELEYIFVVRIPSDYRYYKSVDVLPDDKIVNSVTFAFRKKDY